MSLGVYIARSKLREIFFVGMAIGTGAGLALAVGAFRLGVFLNGG